MPAILVCILFFLIPKDPWHLTTSPPLLDWKITHERVSWGVILLLGGGFAMAKGCEKSGLSLWIGNFLSSPTANLPIPIMSLIILFVASLMTEPTSNAATCTVLLPVLKHLVSISFILFIMNYSILIFFVISGSKHQRRFAIFNASSYGCVFLRDNASGSIWNKCNCV